MPLHPEARGFMDMIEASGLPKIHEQEPAAARQQAIDGAGMLPPGPEVATVEDLRIPVRDGEIGARRYEPEGAHNLIVYVHGGGFVVGNLDTHDALCRILANEARAIVYGIDYRLAPEHPFPGPIDDCFDALTWIAEQHPDLPLTLGGDSAGGNIAAVCTIRARDHGGPRIDHQLLVYPVADLTTWRPSYDEYGEHPDSFLTRADMEYFSGHYIREEDHADPEASPLLAEDLSGLPPATVVIADIDPLRDEGRAYAERLREAGVPVTVHEYDDMTHAFYSFPTVISRGREAIATTAADIRAAVVGRTTA